MKHRPVEDTRGDSTPLVIGWKEWAALPDWGVPKIKVKIDTGARTSALDVSEYDLLEIPDVGMVARMKLNLDGNGAGRDVVVHAAVLKLVSVRNTSGVSERRPLVETRVKIGPKVKRIRLTVTNRAGMLHRMILGRQALAGDFVVDVSRKYLLK